MEHHRTTALYLTENDTAGMELALDTLRRIGGAEEVQVVVVNLSDRDDMAQWAAEQDVTYVFMEEASPAWTESLNKVLDVIYREPPFAGTDLLVLRGPILCLPGSVGKLRRALEENPACGAVGGRINGGIDEQGLTDTIEEAAERAFDTSLDRVRKTFGLDSYVILFRAAALEKIFPFDTFCSTAFSWAIDSGFSLLLAGWDLLIHENAYFWNPGVSLSDLSEEKATGIAILNNKWHSPYFAFRGSNSVINPIDRPEGDTFNVLEIGCCYGRNLLEISRRWPNARCYGLELNEKMARLGSHYFPVAVGNVEEDSIPFEKGFFDVIIAADVLEHLRDPERAIWMLRDYLKEDGIFIAQIPNVMHHSIMRQLLDGDFTYEDSGLLDRTHVHLFTGKEAVKMFQNSGYHIKELGGIFTQLSEKDRNFIQRLLDLGGEAEEYMFEAFEYVFVAEKAREADE